MNNSNNLQVARRSSINKNYETSLVKYEPFNSFQKPSDACRIIPGLVVNFDSEKKNNLLTPNYPVTCTELIDSTEWIKKYGLRTNKLLFENILSMIGFKHAQDYQDQFKRIVSSRYAKGLFLQTFSKDGMVYNITVNENKLIEYCSRLEDAIKMYRLRLQWLNTDSRRLFGVITEQSVCFVLDCKQQDCNKFSQYRNCILKLLREQVVKISSFNIIICSDTIKCFKDKAVIAASQAIEDAIEWLNEWNKDFVIPSSDTTTVEGVLQAFKDSSIEAVYLISESLSSNGKREVLYDNLVKESFSKKIALNVVSYNCVDANTVQFLRRLALNSYGPGKFHAYCLLRQYDDFVPGPIDNDPTNNSIFVNKRVFGGAPPGAGVKSDLMLIFEEMQLAKETLENLNALIESMGKVNNSNKNKLSITDSNTNAKPKQRDDEYMTSKEWLQKHGLASRKLDLFDVLNQVCFRHCDGVVDLKKEPYTGRLFFIGDGVKYCQGDAIPKAKLVNAKYCDQFAHVLWHDGTIMHVHVTPDLHRSYEQKIRIALEQYEKRIDWLSKGSRELFGTVIENNICILIDTSQSMQLSLDFVKRKLMSLMQEQLKNKQRFNLVAFNSKILAWRDRMVDVDEFHMNNAFDWIRSLNAQGTTNTLSAIRFALSDLNTEAIYLLTDGRPDQEPRQILSQIHLNSRIPIHTISFNCNDAEANKFLSMLARETNGRYHYFNENGWDADPEGPIPYQSEDVLLLKQEIEKGQKYLNQIETLREECAKLSVSNKPTFENRKLLLNRDKLASSITDDVGFNISSSNFQSKYSSKASFSKKQQIIIECYFKYPKTNNKLLKRSGKSTNELNRGVLDSLHDIQSLDWILPETREILERQYLNQKNPRKKVETRKKSDHIDNNNNSNNKSKEKKTKSKASTHKSAEDFAFKTHSKSRIKKWIEKNSLAALKLTIFDALLDESNKKPDSVLILDDLYDAKVWQDILEIADASNFEKSRFKLVNPTLINLDSYELKLENQIKTYQKFLADLIWSVLPDREKSILDLKELNYFDESNRDSILKSLAYSNWPVSKEDIELVESQIELARIYKRHCSDLQSYLTKKTLLSSERRAEESIPLETPKENQTLEETQEFQDTNRSSTGRKLSVEEIEEIMSAPAKKEDIYARGDRVIARNDLLGYYFTGRISKVIDSKRASVKFDQGTKQNNMSVKNIIKLSGAGSYLCLGDYVLASVINEFDHSCWVPGIVQTIETNTFPKLYTILYFNGQEGGNTRPELVKINKSAYGFIVNYIRSMLGMKTSVKAYHEEIKPPPPEPRPPTPPDYNDLKKDIVDEIKVYFDSLKFDDKYQKMYDELLTLRRKHKNLKSDLEGRFKLLRKDFEEWKKIEPKIVLPNPNEIIFVPGHQIPEKDNLNGEKDEEDDDNIIKPNKIYKVPKEPQRELSEKDRILNLRHELPELSMGEEVLAKWPDDCWYYRSIVKEKLPDCQYKIEDSLRDVELIYREDIISEISDSNDSFEVGDPVVALHPQYEFSYAPGQIVQVSNDLNKLLVRFYDFSEGVIQRQEVYKLPRIKFQIDVNSIIEKEKEWIGKLVVARNNFSKVYELGKVVSRVGNSRQYTIEWSNGKQSIQNVIHMFGELTRNPAIIVNDYVLAPKETIFLPGRVIGKRGNQLRVRFVDGQIDDNVDYNDTYWLSRDYYEDACNFYKSEHDRYEDNTSSRQSSARDRRTPILNATDFHSGRSDY